MFLIMRNDRIGETLLGEALERVAALLPDSWRLDTRLPQQSSDARDADVELVGPDAKVVVPFVVAAKSSGAVPAALLIPALRELERTSGTPVLFVSDFIGPALRDALDSAGFSFADATGWVRLSSADPLVLLTGQGADRSPRTRRTTAVTRLNGLAASRTIRALATVDPPVGVRRLAQLADVSPGSVSKLLVTLAAEGVVDRGANRAVVAVRRRALLRRWVVDYSFVGTNLSVGYFIAPRGLERTLDRLGGQMGVALTGAAAARRLLPEGATPVVPLRLLAVYAAHPADLAVELGLIDAGPTIANVIIARPQDVGILSDQRPPVTAPIPLVIADLLTLPGRAEAEAEQLMNVLALTDEAWKE